jgi:membrane-bound serine protease (ClpP class)
MSFRISRWIAVTLLLSGVALAASQEQPADPDENEVPSKGARAFVATYEGVINPVAAEYLSDTLSEATLRQGEVLVIRLDTPGGLDTSMRLIIKDITASEIPVIVYVAPTGARAASAGVFITLAAHIAAMSPGTNIGAAHPVAMGGGEMDEEMKKKVENDAAAYIKSLAEERGRNVTWAEDAVRQSVSATEKEALDLGVIDLIADDLISLMAMVHGREVETVRGKQTLQTKDASIEFIPISLRLKILNALSNPNIAYILMMLGIYGLIFELSNPGAILPGVVGAICLILAFYSFQTLPINYAGLLLILLGIILFIVEINVPSFGLLTMGGIISLALGSLMLVKTKLPYMRISYYVIFPTVLATALFFALVLGMAWKAHRHRPMTGIEDQYLTHRSGPPSWRVVESQQLGNHPEGGRDRSHGRRWTSVAHQTPQETGLKNTCYDQSTFDKNCNIRRLSDVKSHGESVVFGDPTLLSFCIRRQDLTGI